MVIKDGALNGIELLIFDIDQTLVDFDCFDELVVRIFKEEQVEMPVGYWDNYLAAVQSAMRVAVDEPVFCFNHIAKTLKEKNIDAIDPVHFFKLWIFHEGNHVKMIPGANTCLDKLSKDYRIVSATNWFYDSQHRKLSKFDLMKYFSKIYTCENVHAKPNILHFMNVLEQENIEPSKAVMIGDSSADIPSKELGIRNILFDQHQTKFHLYDSSDVVVTELTDIPKVLAKKRK